MSECSFYSLLRCTTATESYRYSEVKADADFSLTGVFTAFLAATFFWVARLVLSPLNLLAAFRVV
jgi:hypothetical protein